MSATAGVLLLVAAVALTLFIAEMEVRWTRRTRAASLRLEREARERREARMVYGGRRLP